MGKELTITPSSIKVTPLTTAFARYGASRRLVGWVDSPPSQPPSQATARQEHGAAVFARAKTGRAERGVIAPMRTEDQRHRQYLTPGTNRAKLKLTTATTTHGCFPFFLHFSNLKATNCRCLHIFRRFLFDIQTKNV